MLDNNGLNVTNDVAMVPSLYGANGNYKQSNGQISEATYEINRNKRANIRDNLVSFVNGLSINDIASVKTQASMLSILTGRPNEITRKSAEDVTNQCIRLALLVCDYSGTSSVEDLEQAAIGLVSTMVK